MNHKTNMLDDIMALEGGDSECMQRVINSGTGWSLQGSYGRSMMAAIENGDCMLGRNASHDAYGNAIPSRTDVVSGTKGSMEYVADHHDQAYADRMASV